MSDVETLRPLSDSERETLERAVTSYQGEFDDETEAYLDGRGVGTAERFKYRLGIVGGEGTRPEHQRYRGMLAIPYLDRTGSPLSVRFRCLQNHDHREKGHGRYNSLAGEVGRLYNIKAIFDAVDTIHITEGEVEAIILEKLGYHAVGIPGAQAWKSHHRRMVAGFSKIYVWGDPDEAGADFSKKVIKNMRQARIITPTLGDVNETYLKGGPEAVHDLYEKAK